MEYEVIRSKRKTASIEIKSDGRILVRVPNRMPQRDIDRMLSEKEAWIEKHLANIEERIASSQEEAVEPLAPEDIDRLTKKARAYLTARCDLYATQLGVTYNRISIRKQRTRWGSCSSKGNLNFNVLLMMAPIDVIDYVVIHELCHRKEMNHSKRFWALVESQMPDYKECRRWLRENGDHLMARLPEREDQGEHFVYILRCADGSFYTGYTNNLEKRLAAHNDGSGAKYTRVRTPVELVYYEEYENKTDAMRREALIKQLSKRQKEKLINNIS